MRPLSNDYLNYREGLAKMKGFPKPKWITFCEVMLRRGFAVSLHEAKTTVSKYIYVSKYGEQFKVRFSNHGPNWKRASDCNFVVGKNDRGGTTTGQAIAATLAFFEIKKEEREKERFDQRLRELC